MTGEYAHLGPPPPTAMLDVPPVRIISWGALTETNGLGEAIVTFHLQYPGSQRECSAMLFLNRLTLGVMRVTVLVDGESVGNVMPDMLPGNIIDLAKTRVRELFHVGFDAGIPS